ncbi:hypothetical protein ACWCOW_29855 [Streptomyces sp. NPDC001939]
MKTRQGTALAALALTTGLVLTAAGCGDGGGGKADPKPTASPEQTARQHDDTGQPPSPPPSNQTLAEVKNKGITLTVDSATRDQGGFLTLSGNVTNGSGQFWLGSEWKSDETELQANGGSLAGASVVDQAGRKRYLVLRDTRGRCLCTKFQGGVQQGGTATWFAQFPAPPEGTTKVQLQVPTMPPATIQISEGK